MSDNGKTYNVAELAALLKLKPQTIRAKLLRNPDSLPPCIRQGRRVPIIWMDRDVQPWLEKMKGEHGQP